MSTKYVSFIEGLKSNLPALNSPSRVLGAFYVTTDTNEIFVSDTNSYNKLSDVVIAATEADLPLAGTEKANKIYYVSETNSLYTVKTGTSGPEWVRSGEDTFAEIDANGAVALANALYLSSGVGSATKGVYFDNGVPVAMTYSLAKDVPSDAEFTDTTYSEGAGIAITNANVVKAKLKSETASSLTAAAKGSTAGREYAVGVDANGHLSVNVPWTGGSGGGGCIEGYYNETDGKFYEDDQYTTEITGTSGMIYVTLDTDLTYRYDSTDGFVQLSEYDVMDSSEATTGTATTGKLISAKVLDDAIVGKGYTTNDGTVTSVSGGVGLTGTVSSSGSIKANLKSETASALTAAAKGSTADREYAVGVDANGNLSVNIPWENSSAVTSVNTKTGAVVLGAADVGAIPSSDKGANGGVAELDNTGKVPSSQLPSYVDDVIEGYYNETDHKFYKESTYTTEIVGESGKIYVTLDTNISFRWSGSAFVEISSSLALGETSSTAYRGDRGKAAYDHASDSSKHTTAESSGLYKIATTAEGHIASVTAVQKADITALGIPGSDTTYDVMDTSEATTGTSTTGKLISAKVLDDAIEAKGYSTTTGTVTSVSGGVGLTGSVSTTGSIKANLKSETASSLTAASKGEVEGREYAVGIDANGNLSVNVPWANSSAVTSVNTKTGDVILDASDVGAIPSTSKGANNGVAELDSTGKVPSTQLPSFVDDVIEGYLNAVDGKFYKDSTYTTEIPGEAGKIYVTLDTNVTYRWSGSVFTEISASLTLGETSSTAYRGDRGKTAYDHANDSSRLTTAQSSGLYKISTTAEGHVASVAAVQKADITALGIPESDTTYDIMDGTEATTGTSTTGKLISAKVLDDAIEAKGYTTSTGTVTSVSGGVGLTGTVSSSGSIKANLKSETASALTAASKGSTADREYAVGVDANGNLSVNIPWTDTHLVEDVNGYTGSVSLVAEDVGAIAVSEKGAALGIAELDANGKVPSSQLPSFVDDVIEGYYNTTDHKFYKESTYTTEITGESGKIYVTLDTDKTYRWSGSAFIEISESLALGETSSTAYRGDRGKTAYDHASDSSRLTTAQSSGLYKIATTAEGHVASVAAVQKSDITALGIPGSDTTYDVMDGAEATTGTSTTGKLISAKVLDDAITAKGYTTNTGTVTSVSGGVGLTGSVSTTGSIKANLKSEIASTLTASAKGSTTDREYAVGVDANGNLSVNIPWTDTHLVEDVNGYTGSVSLVAEDVGAIAVSEKGAALGVATLDSSGYLKTSEMPASGVTAGTAGSTAAQTPSFGDTFTVPYVTTDTYGRTTAQGTANVTIPATGASSSAAGLMSSAHYTKVANLPVFSNVYIKQIGDTHVTITDSRITENSLIEPQCSTASGKPIVWEKIEYVGSNSVKITFDSALTEAASIRVRITNSFT